MKKPTPLVSFSTKFLIFSVNAANGQLAHGGGVAAAIARKGGRLN